MVDSPRPTLKTEVAIDWHGPFLRVVYLWATPDAVEEFRAFGDIDHAGLENKYCLHVDGRYDFAEVVTYIQNYGGSS